MLRKVLLTLLMVAFLGSMAWAVEVNPGGQGDALIMGYYNARNALTYFRIVNTSDKGIVGKIRFREGKRSEEVLDFIVCLSPQDEFSMILVDGGETAPAVLYKGTDMISDADTTTVPGNWTMVPLRYGATGAAATVTMDDTKEGYVEFIALSAYGVEDIDSDQCKELAETGSTELADGSTVTAEDAPNAVMGAVEIVKYTDSLPIFSYKATALKDTTTAVQTSFPATGTDTPLFNDVVDGGIAALNEALSKSALYAMYDIRGGLGAATDLLVLFPTKKETYTADEATFNAMYTEDFNTDNATMDLAKRCVVVKYDVYDDAEDTIQQELDFSPYTVQTNSLCYEVNYVSVGEMASSILDTSLSGVNVQTGSFNFGWLKVYFDNQVDNDTMPVLGYELQVWADGALSRMLEMSYDANTSGTATP